MKRNEKMKRKNALNRKVTEKNNRGGKEKVEMKLERII